MKAAIIALCLAVAVSAAPIAIAPRGGQVIPDEFIITLDTTSDATLQQVESEIEKIVKASNGAVLHKYEHSVQGFAIRTNEEGVAMLRKMNGVHIEANLVMRTMYECNDQADATWGLVRVSEHDLKIDGHYHYESESAGAAVDAYIIDTGIYTEHSDFEGRATWGTDTVDSPSPKTDGNGHGTHVAGTVAGKTYGIAKKANLIAVKVLGASGSGSTAGVIKGVDWTTEAAKKSGKKSVANMSLGGGFSTAMNAAVDAAVTSGIAFAVAAGNENQNACNRSPASAALPLTVGATTNLDARSYFSNWGTCVDVFAPGSAVTSDWIGSKTAVNTISGTSMASPHVAGVLARYFSAFPASTAAEAQKALVDVATNDKITDVRTGSPNKLLFGACRA